MKIEEGKAGVAKIFLESIGSRSSSVRDIHGFAPSASDLWFQVVIDLSSDAAFDSITW